MKPAAHRFALLLSLLRRFVLRYWARHWVKFALLIGIVALGSGSFLAIGLANRAAASSFDTFAQTVSGRSHITVTASTGALKFQDIRSARIALLDSDATLVPQLLATGKLVGSPDDATQNPDTSFTFIGIDLLAASNFLIRQDASETFIESFSELNPSEDGILQFYSESTTANRFGWDRSPTATFVFGDNLVELNWTNPIPQLETTQETESRVLVMDWNTLADLIKRPQQADRLDIVFIDERDRDLEIEKAVDQLKQRNPGYWVIETQDQRQNAGATMTQALRMNLRALSALSLLVALCLVFQAMDSTIARRQGEIAILHSIGVSAKLTRFLWLSDAAFIGVVGGGVGIFLGGLMARFSTNLVTETVDQLYHRTSNAGFALDPTEVAIAWALSIVACMAAGWWPARQAANAPLIESMREGAKRSSYSRSSYIYAGIILSILAWASLKIPPLEAANGHAIPVGGYALALLLIGVLTCFSCVFLELLGSLAKPFGYHYPALRLALSQFRKPVTRHRLALAGVTISVGMTASMVFMIGSFESTVRAWINSALNADLYVQSRASESMYDQTGIDPETIAEIRANAPIADSGTILKSSLRIGKLTTSLVGFDTGYLHRNDHTTWLQKPRNLPDLGSGQTALINETFSHRFKKSIGDSIGFNSPIGPVSFTVIGIFADYGNEGGSIGIDSARYIEITGNNTPVGLALHLKDSSKTERVIRSIEDRYPGLKAVSNRWLREESLRIFKRVFSITYALEIIGLFIAVAGLGSMLASLLIERRNEIGAMMRLGVSPKQLSKTILCEGLALATLGTLNGLVLGSLLGLVLVFIINRQSFGWTLQLDAPWLPLLALGVLALAGATLVSHLVGRWANQLQIQNEE